MRISEILTEQEKNNDYQNKFRDKRIVDYVKFGQVLLYLKPISTHVGQELTKSLHSSLSNVLKAIEGETLYNGLEREMNKKAEFWYSQVRRDIMNRGRDIPDSILIDRLAEAKATIEVLHFLKLVTILSNENSLVKKTFWKTKFIFVNYLFEQNVNIFVAAEKIILSMGLIAKNSQLILSQVGKNYSKCMMKLFSTVIDFIDVTFEELSKVCELYWNKSNRKSNMTHSFLKAQKIENFLDVCGGINIEGSTAKKSADIKNIRYFKILIYYSKGFSKFIKDIASNLEGQDSIPSQIICILCQIIPEINNYKCKVEDRAVDNKENEVVVVVSAAAVKKEEMRKKKVADKMRGRFINTPLIIRPEKGAIIFKNEQDEEKGYVRKTKISENLDKKTQKYLDYVKQFEYEDEYDDTLEMRKKNKMMRKMKPSFDNRNQGGRNKDDFDSDSSVEDNDPMLDNRNNRRGRGGYREGEQNRNQLNKDSEEFQVRGNKRKQKRWEQEREERNIKNDRNANDRGYHRTSEYKTNRGRGGRGRGSWNQKMKQNKRDYHRKQNKKAKRDEGESLFEKKNYNEESEGRDRDKPAIRGRNRKRGRGRGRGGNKGKGRGKRKRGGRSKY